MTKLVFAAFFSLLSLSLAITRLHAQAANVVVDSFASTADGHNGLDYGYTVNAAVASVPAGTVATLEASSGSHTVWTPIVINKSITMKWNGANLVPQSGGASGTWGTAPVSITGCTLTPGNVIVTCPATTGIVAGMRVGGPGLATGSFVSCAGTYSGSTCNASATRFTLSAPDAPALDVVCALVTGSTVASGCNSMIALASGQTISGAGIAGSTAFSALHYGGSSATDTQGFTLATAATATGIEYLTLSSPWTATLTFQKVFPVVTWAGGTSGIVNRDSQMIFSAESDLAITDPGFRSLAGVQGEQVTQIDLFESINFRARNLAGSGLILGGATSSATAGAGVRESNFVNAQVRNSGEHFTGQASLEILTGPSGCPGACNSQLDEINQIGFLGGQAVYSYGSTLVVGTYNTTHSGTNGPRLWHFSDNFQFEGGSDSSPAQPHAVLDAPDDMITVYQGASFSFSQGSIAAPGYGRFLFRSMSDNGPSFVNTAWHPAAKPLSYSVTSAGGSTVITYVSGGTGSFDASGFWDGQAAILNDGASCTPCQVYLATSGSVNSSGTTVTLAAPLFGSTPRTNATLTLGKSGYSSYFNSSGGALPFFAGGEYTDQNATDLAILGMTNAAQAYLGTQPTQLDYDQANNFQGTTNFLGSTYVTGPNTRPFTVTSTQPASGAEPAVFLAPNLPGNSGTFIALGTALTAINNLNLGFRYTGAGSSSNYGYLNLSGGAVTAIKFFSNGQTLVGGPLTMPAIAGSGDMTISLGAAAGTGATIACSSVCTGVQGTVTVTTGSATKTGALAALTFPLAHAHSADCVADLYLPTSGMVSNWEPSTSSTAFSIRVDSAALLAGTAYRLTYWCGGI